MAVAVRKPVLLIIAALTVAYPLLVWFGIGKVSPAWLALMLVVVAGLRAVATRQPIWLVAAFGGLLLAAAAAFGNSVLPLKFYPVLVNAVLLAVFAISLRHPPSAIERLARMQEPDLPESGVRYTRRVTQVWCGFFIVNGSIALATVLWASEAAWALYNGLIAYLLMGLLFAGEWLVRRRVRAAEA